MKKTLKRVATTKQPAKWQGWRVSPAPDIHGVDYETLEDLQPKTDLERWAQQIALEVKFSGASDVRVKTWTTTAAILCSVPDGNGGKGAVRLMNTFPRSSSAEQSGEIRLRPGVPCRQWPAKVAREALGVSGRG